MRKSPWMISPQTKWVKSQSYLSCHHLFCQFQGVTYLPQKCDFSGGFNLEAMHFSEIVFRIFLVHIMLCQFLPIKHQKFRVKVCKLGLCMYGTGRCHAGTQKLCMNLRSSGWHLPRFSWGCGLPLPWSMMQSWQMMGFPFGIPKKKHVRILVVTGILGGEDSTQPLENLQIFFSWSFKKMGGFIIYSIISALIRNLADSFMSNTVSLFHLLNCKAYNSTYRGYNIRFPFIYIHKGYTIYIYIHNFMPILHNTVDSSEIEQFLTSWC